MPNISSNSLDVSSLIEDEPKKAPLSSFLDEVREEEFARTRDAIKWARQYQPEAYARAHELAPDLSPERGVRQLELLEDVAGLQAYQEIFDRAPSLRSYFLENPKNLPFANPDELDNISGLQWLVQAGSESAEAGALMVRAAQASNRIAAGQGTIEDRAFLNNYQGGRTFGARSFLEEAFVGLGQQIAPLVGTGLSGAVGALKGSVYGGTTGAVAGTVLPGIGTLVGGTTGAAYGARVGAAYGAVEFQRQLQTGLSRIALQEIRDETGQPLDPAAIELAANIAGLGGAALEQIANTQILRTIPGADRIAEWISPIGMTKLLRSNPEVRNAFTSFARNLATTMGVEISTEVMQEGLQVLVEEVAKANAEGDFQQRSTEEVVTELGSAAYQALQIMTLMGPFASGTRLASDLAKINSSKRERQNLIRIMGEVEGNGLVERAPSVAAEVIDAQTQGKKLYIPADEMRELYQAAGKDLYGPALPNWRQRIDEALSTGGDVEITFGEFIAHLSKDAKDTPLADLVRTDPADFLPQEIAEYTAQVEALLQSDMARAQATGLPAPEGPAGARLLEPSRIQQELEQQVLSAGFTPGAAKHYSVMLGAFFDTMSKRAGKTPDELAAEYGLRIVRERGTRSRQQNVLEEPQTTNEFFQPAWHGSPHLFDNFSLDAIGTGEGAQAFGWGLYFTGNRNIAEGYRDRLIRTVSPTFTVGEQSINFTPTELRLIHGALPIHDGTVGDFISELRESIAILEADIIEINQDLTQLNSARAQEVIDRHAAFNFIEEPKETLVADLESRLIRYGNELTHYKEIESKVKGLPENERFQSSRGRLYQVNLPEDDQLLDWEKVYFEQLPAIQEALATLGVGKPVQTPEQLAATEIASTVEKELEPDSEQAMLLQLSLEGGGFNIASPEILASPIYLYELKHASGTSEYVWSLNEPATEQTLRDWLSGEELVSGADIYQELSFRLGSEQAASQALREAGVLGHRYYDANSRGAATERSYNYVIYDERAIQIEEYFQENRGSITLGETSVIRLFDQADLSTLLHESGHFFLNTLRGLANSSESLRADWDAVRKHLKIPESGEITREQHERFARLTESYFMEGKAPAPELRSAFEAFRSWLKAIYRRITALGQRVSPELREIFDRMLVSEQRLEALSADRAYAPLFESAEAMGVSPEEYLRYQELVESLKVDALDAMREKVQGQTKRLAKGWRGEIQKQLAREAEDKLRKLPPYSHREILEEGKLSIDRKLLEEKYGKESLKKFPRKALKANALAPDVVAELLGYPTADDMVYDFVQALPIKEAAKQAAAVEMQQRYGEDFENSPVMDLAIERALADDRRLSVLATEYTAINKRVGKPGSPSQVKQLAVQVARNTIYAKRVRDVNEYKTRAAVKRAATMTESAIVKGDWQKAADWKRKQILAQALDNETQTLNKAIEKIRAKAAKYTRTAPKSIDPATMEQIRALVTQYEFGKISNKKLAKRESLREYIDKAAEEGLVLQVPDYLLRQAERTNYKELSVEDLLALGDVLDNLEHVGRLKQKLRTAQGLREWQEVKAEVLNQLNSLPKTPRKKKTYADDEKRWKDTAIGFFASTLKPEQIIAWLDADNIAGPMMQHVFQPIVEAQNERNDLNLQYNEALVKAFEGIDSSYLTDQVHIRSLNVKMSKEEIYAVALNTGNESNRLKLLQGELWNEGTLEEILSHMTSDDWARVQKVWDLLDKLWERVAALEKRLTGVTPPKIEAREFTNQHGTFRGGYYPVVYDFRDRRGLNLIKDTTPADRRLGEDLFSAEFIRPGTNHKHTVKRTATAKPIRLKLSVLPGHIHNVIHDLTHREAVRAAYKILWDPEVRRAIEDAESPQVYQQLQHWLRSVASDKAQQENELTPIAHRLRVGMTMYGMGFRVTTALAQPLGFFNSMARVDKRHLAAGIYQMSRHPQATVEMVNGLSGEMKSRFNAQDRDLKDTVKKLSLAESKLDRVRRYAFHHIAYMDRYVSTATWLGAYQQFLETNPGQDALAIQHADRTVRLTQGTGSAKDLAKIANDGEIQRLFTMFYSAFSAIWNMQVDLTRKTKRDIAEGDWNTLFTERLPQWAYVVVFPAIFGAILGGQTPEEDENYAAWMAKVVAMYGVAGIPFVRDIASAMNYGFDYSMSPVSRFFNSSIRALDNLFEGDIPGAAKPAAEAVSIGFKLPTGQALNTVEGLWKGLENDDLEPQDLIYGRRDK